ncbi:hypothetical protein IFM47457_05225 [Aspergillus lentulus]|nr:hypothetical protein IFM47457_05225 [Aspergillus lentulus]
MATISAGLNQTDNLNSGQETGMQLSPILFPGRTFSILKSISRVFQAQHTNHEQHHTQQERGCLWCFWNQAWAIVHEIPNDYPSPTTFDYVTALTNSPLSRDVAQWPSSDKFQVVSGLDLLRGGQASLEDEIKKYVQGLEETSHLYFCAYVMNPELEQKVPNSTRIS